ncbi:beta-ketoacyl-ACP synthase II [Francisella tularensis]|uniref:beta-ketoacyl-ACP synthase II n=1 Tax=Francisella tularensis TaxID=263 RepID=UPI001C0EDAB9|nr:beta-ketoacyl-ACP synthase II [Francisella tularensis]MBK2164703.1 beta-ketoacyl-ACP synthase II [Francisella tularensis]MBK2167901.1 beta-ketoacyl-ACP synthase II [Francisella tularensis]
MKSNSRVVVTGLGMVTPLGNDVPTTWANILAGKSGVETITGFDTPAPDISEFKVRFAARIKNFDVDALVGKKDAKRVDPFCYYGIAAANEALKDAGIDKVSEEDSYKFGVCVSSGIGGIETLETTKAVIDTKGPSKISPFCIPSSIVNMLSGIISINHGLRGPNIPIVTACTTGTHNIGMAARLIASGDADAMLAGGSEKASNAIGMGGFAAARALSTRNDDPQGASRPWDKDRDGFVLGDGAGVVVLEEYERAKARGAKIYAEVVGFGMSADGYHMTMPYAPGQERCIQNALADAGLENNPDAIDYVNAHGTSTPLGDVQESQVVEKVIGQYRKDLVMSSTKSMTGHLLGAAGAIESIFSVLAIRDQVAPPTINLHNLDDGCNLDYAANAAKKMKIDYVLNNSFGFGGTNGSVIFKKI